MSNPNFDDQEEKPLDPAVARVQARLQRLMLISGLTLGLGILAVFLAIIYRIATMDNKASVAPGAEVPVATVPQGGSALGAQREAVRVAQATVPADARLIASTVAGDRIVLTYDHFAGTVIILVDPKTLEVVGRLDVKPE